MLPLSCQTFNFVFMDLVSPSELRRFEQVLAKEVCPFCGKTCSPSISFAQRSNIDKSSGVWKVSVINCCCEGRKQRIIDFLTHIASIRRVPKWP